MEALVYIAVGMMFVSIGVVLLIALAELGAQIKRAYRKLRNKS